MVTKVTVTITIIIIINEIPGNKNIEHRNR